MQQLLMKIATLEQENARLREESETSSGSNKLDELKYLEEKAQHAEARLSDLSQRILELEKCSHEKALMPSLKQSPSTLQESTTTDPRSTAESSMETKMKKLSKQMGIDSTFKRCPKDYYDQSLEWRRDLLGAPSTEYLCKTIVMHNTKNTDGDFSSPINSKYYLIVVQYVARFNNEKLIRHMRDQTKLGKKKFNFRLVSAEENYQLTGFEHNGVTLMGCKEKLPVIISHRLTRLPYVWLGGGEVDLKWKASVQDLIKHWNPQIVDITYEE